MNNLTVFEYLNNLSKSEFKRFELFLKSPYFNNYKTIILLFQYLKTKYPYIKRENVTPSSISLIVYGEENVNNVKIRKLISDFKKLFEKFLHHEFINRRTLTNADYLDFLNKKEMHELYSMNLNEASLLLEKTIVKDNNYYLNKFQLYRTSSLYKFNYKHSSDFKQFNESLNNLDYHFIFLKLSSFITIYFIKISINWKPGFNNNFSNEIMEFIRARKKYFSTHHHFIYALYLMVEMFSTMDDKYYDTLKRYYENHKEKFRGMLISEYYTYMSSFLRLKILFSKTDSSKYRQKLYNIYTQIFDSKNKYNYLFISGRLEGSLFIQVVTVYLGVGDFERAVKFIGSYKKHLHIEIRDNAYNYALGVYYYYLNDLRTAVTYYNKISNKDPMYRYSRKVALIKLYYELNELFLMETEMKNLYQFSYRYKGNFKNGEMIPILLKYFRMLIKLKSINPRDKRTIRFEKIVIRKQIDNYKNHLHHRTWFLKMIK